MRLSIVCDNSMRSRLVLLFVAFVMLLGPLRTSGAVRDFREEPLVISGPLTRTHQSQPADSSAPLAPPASPVRDAVSVPKARPPLVPAESTSDRIISTDSRIALPAVEVRTAVPVDRPQRAAGLNSIVLELLKRMPKGGKYSTSAKSTANLRAAIGRDKNKALKVEPSVATPSFCSSATYLVFLMVLQSEEERGRCNLDASTSDLLAFRHQEDGEGVWGRWNANGPGTGCLFEEAELGVNFDDITAAQPGDFLKIWWTDEVGHKEKGHSVIYLGRSAGDTEEPKLKFWSSNIPDGYGEKEVPLSSVKHMLFSRLTNPGAVRRLKELKAKDGYLAAMKERGSTWDEVREKAGIGRGHSLKKTYKLQKDSEAAP